MSIYKLITNNPIKIAACYDFRVFYDIRCMGTIRESSYKVNYHCVAIVICITTIWMLYIYLYNNLEPSLMLLRSISNSIPEKPKNIITRPAICIILYITTLVVFRKQMA